MTWPSVTWPSPGGGDPPRHLPSPRPVPHEHDRDRNRDPGQPDNSQGPHSVTQASRGTIVRPFRVTGVDSRM
jgi:hypothetical protein